MTLDSKTDACMIAHRMGKPVEWEFGCDYVYKNYDWSIEPEQSLDFYYDKRAREIREKYEYVLVAYSGGSDSHNLVMSFIRQGLHIDELFTSHMTKAAEKHIDMTGKSTSPETIEAEYVLNVAPKLEKLRHLMPKTKFTCYDMSERNLNFIETDDESWVTGLKEFRNAFNFRYDWFANPEFKKTMDRGLSTAIVVGADKPRTYIKDGEFYIFFSDTSYGPGTPYSFAKKHKYTNMHIEYFYLEDSTVDMVCKQAHAIKRCVEANPKWLPFWDISKMNGNYREIYRTYHEKWMIPIIYTTWDDGFQALKSANGLWKTEYDQWWRKTVDSRQLVLYDRGMQYLEDKAKNFVLYENGVAQSLMSFRKDYKIGEINTK